MKRNRIHGITVILLIVTLSLFAGCATAAADQTPVAADSAGSEQGVPLAEAAPQDTEQAASGDTVTTVPLSSGSSTVSNDIGLEIAKGVATDHAGAPYDQVVFTKQKRSYDDGILEYEIKFTWNGVKYDYEIAASDGAVLKASQKPVTGAAATAAGDDIGLEKAKTIALEHAGVSADQAVFTKAKLDHDDGIAEYDIEFVADSTLYEFEIRASDGTVTQFSQEGSTRVITGVDGDDIGLEKAKAIALNHAGLTEDQVTFTKIKQDYDDGIPEYELEWVANGREYEYTIHASSGKILEADIESVNR